MHTREASLESPLGAPAPERASRHAAVSSLVFVVLLAAAMLWRPVLFGSPARHAALYALFLAVHVVLPGWLVHRSLCPGERDPLLRLGMSWTLGLAVETAAWLALEIAGFPAAFPWYPLALLPLLLLRRAPRRAPAQGPREPALALRAVHVVLLFALVALAAQRTVPLSAEGWWREIDPDVYFHAGNAAEMRFHWPLRDPRFAGLPLNYHFFSYALPAGASQVTGVAVSELALRLCTTTGPVLLALQVYNAGRVFGGSPAAGLVASALVVLHADLGEAIAVLIGAGTPSWAFNSFLDRGIYYSASTALGLVLFATLAIVLRRWLAAGATADWRSLALAAAIAAMASGVKGSVMPIALAGMAAVWIWTLVARRTLAARVAIALAALLAASAPMTLELALGEGSYASSMFRPSPGFIVESCAFFPIVAGWLGLSAESPPAWFEIAMVPVWIAGYAGLAGVGAALFLVRDRARGEATEAWILWSAVAGIAVALLLEAPGFSQLFFAYNGQVGLAILAGGAIVRALAPRSDSGIVARAIVWVLAAATLVGAARRTFDPQRAWPSRGAPRPALAPAYERGLAWIRQHTPADAVLVSGHSWILLSVYAERRTLYETARYTPGAYERKLRTPGRSPDAGVAHDPVAARVALRNRFLAGPDADTLAEVRALVGATTPIYVVLDAVQYRVDRNGEQWFSIDAVRSPPASSPLWHLEFSDEAAQIYRIDDRVR